MVGWCFGVSHGLVPGARSLRAQPTSVGLRQFTARKSQDSGPHQAQFERLGLFSQQSGFG